MKNLECFWKKFGLKAFYIIVQSEIEKDDNLKFTNEQLAKADQNLNNIISVECNFYVETYINSVNKLFIDPGINKNFYQNNSKSLSNHFLN